MRFTLTLPQRDDLARLFRNTNWASFIAPDTFTPSTYRSSLQLPATQFKDAAEQKRAVDQIIDLTLSTVPNLIRDDFDAFEWAPNKITDNVLVHSGSVIGGLFQVSTFQKDRKCVEFVVADAGLGIPKTLRPSHPEITSDEASLESAIQEGVTRDQDVGQGNGLYGSYSICRGSKGSFRLESGFGRLSYSRNSGLEAKAEKVPFHGTLVTAQVNFADPHLLAQALRFKGMQYAPTGSVDLRYERPEENEIVFIVKQETTSLGSRVAGTVVRHKLKNLLQMFPDQAIVVDFKDVSLVSSSFADEVIGKLFLELGPLTFSQRCRVRNTRGNVQQLVDKAITQRMRQ